MILSSFEAIAMAGWVCVLQLRVLEIIEECEPGKCLTIGDFIKHERVDGLFDREKKVGDGTEKLCEIVLESINSIYPDRLEIIKDGDHKHYVVLGKSEVAPVSGKETDS